MDPETPEMMSREERNHLAGELALSMCLFEEEDYLPDLRIVISDTMGNAIE